MTQRKGRNKAHDLEVAGRRGRVARYLAQGKSVQDIALLLDVTPYIASQDVQRVINEQQKLQGFDTKSAILLMAFRYDMLIAALWPLAVPTYADGKLDDKKPPNIDAQKQIAVLMRDYQTLLGLRAGEMPNEKLYKKLDTALRKHGFDPDKELAKVIADLDAKKK